MRMCGQALDLQFVLIGDARVGGHCASIGDARVGVHWACSLVGVAQWCIEVHRHEVYQALQVLYAYRDMYHAAHLRLQLHMHHATKHNQSQKHDH